MRLARPAVALVVASLLLPGAAESASALTLEGANANEKYVISVYEDLFGRAPDPTGRTTWTTALGAGTPRIAVANSITSSVEFRSGLIIDAYEEYLGRGPDAPGLQFWLRNMAGGMTIEQLHSGFIASDEYWARAGATGAGWVSALYVDVLGREAGGSEVAFWLDELNRGATRAQVAMGFLLSTEYLSSVVDGYYWWLLGRGLDPSGLGTWVSAIQQGARDEQVIGGIIASEEYWANETSRPFVGYIILSPREETSVPLGTGWTYTVEAYEPNGAPIGDVTDEAHITWDGQPCTLGYCQPTSVGPHEIHAVHRGVNARSTLTVVPAQ
ncbi:DUF4214 domain-containing protein [Cellulomonas fengjieae]|uniref:DUF4214 domain-containing protein n=1 Tax=Cellulomonas fengjieae TaxID=2819978 RepID=UPI002111EBA2|nr:DUF4214 domain-containing protein [Cellulomonas fengjieae]